MSKITRVSVDLAKNINLGSITKHADMYLRTLLIQGAKSVVLTSRTPSDPVSQWAQHVRERCGWQKAVVALANKNARIVWAVLSKGERFDAHHVSISPPHSVSVG